MIRAIAAFLIVLLAFPCAAQVPDTTSTGRGLWGRIRQYMSLEDSTNAPVKRFSIGVLGGPSYASDSRLGLGLAGMAQYRLNGCDSIQPSNATITAVITTAGFWKLGVEGSTIFPDEKMRLNYELNSEYAPRDFWGMGYDNGNIDQQKTKLHEHDYKLKAELLFRLANNLYAGPMLQWNYANSGSVENPQLFEGQDQVVRNYGLGFTVQYDSRDLITNAYKGVYLYINQVFRPRLLWNRYAFSTTDLRACYYHRAWHNAVVASEVRALFNLGNPSWAMMSQLGDSHTMRGYYHGRYRDKHSLTVQLELRQRVWRRFGLVLWGGAGSVFHDADSFRHWLPNYGLGLRWEFRRRINVRLDYGFGRCGQSGFMFNINEAF